MECISQQGVQIGDLKQLHEAVDELLEVPSLHDSHKDVLDQKCLHTVVNSVLSFRFFFDMFACDRILKV